MTGETVPLGSSPSLGDLQAQVEAQRQQVQAARQRLDEDAACGRSNRSSRQSRSGCARSGRSYREAEHPRVCR